MAKYKLLLIIIVIVAAVIGAAFWLFKSSQEKVKNLPGQTFENLGQQHIDQGSTNHPPYNSNPPTSGWHWPQPADWGVYSTTLPDEELVHNLEHGGIWISYKPDKVDQNTINMLNDFAKRYPLIVVEPREKNDAAISLAAWTHLENLDHYDERLILEFISAFHNRGPEKVI
ncbi:MAG: DUF3105 domain-containing protein [Candidatus Doudnabacteria bacterium]|nr:DUF3105 domain-containing protein [Candidatus Doudnabacteria bacterium]